MGEVERRLIDQASRMHEKIYPCCHKRHFNDCFTRHEDQILFWYNTEDQSTHVLTAEICKTEKQDLA